ncbi:hypothetical protein E2562_022544 [Oryza meyeriana var. granulata]|uniref:Uncharacterized protein n=1 Tax=Oryza meyeriana var. granulata TaxID=110450 RepID=A0A6G1FAU8_9ORYZ|nr:hypothetical protein E2562_022544 [Oryza meyeriana var. granulata]
MEGLGSGQWRSGALTTGVEEAASTATRGRRRRKLRWPRGGRRRTSRWPLPQEEDAAVTASWRQLQEVAVA